MINKCIILGLVCLNSQVIFAELNDCNLKSKLLPYKSNEPIQLVKNNLAELKKPMQASRKSPIMAFLIALGPGVVIHGAGHYYVGDYKTGCKLLGGEVISYIIGMYGMVLVNEYTSNRINAKPDATLEGIGQFLIIAGGCGFVATWIYDLIAAPISTSNTPLQQKGSSMQLRDKFICLGPDKYFYGLDLSIKY
jgi:hypothetical protein